MLIHAITGSVMRHGISSHFLYIVQMLSPPIPFLVKDKNNFQNIHAETLTLHFLVVMEGAKGLPGIQ